MKPSGKTWAAVVLLGVALVCSTVLTAMGVLTKTELLPLLGGTVVVAHRLLDVRVPERAKRPSTPPPSAGVGVLLGMLGAGLASAATAGMW